jgi:hypothetical protein
METAFAASQNTSANRITQLEKQVAQLTAEVRKLRPQTANPHANKPTGPIAQPTLVCLENLWDFTTNTGTPGPSTGTTWPWKDPAKQHLSWADSLSAEVRQPDKEKPFTTIECKKKKTPTTVIPKALPRTDNEVIITLREKVTDNTTLADQALQAINKVIKESADITQPPFILACITSNNRLVLTTNPTTKASEYTPYLQIIANITQQLKPTETRINERWTKFLLHNVPTNANLPAVRNEIEATYPSLCLC